MRQVSTMGRRHVVKWYACVVKHHGALNAVATVSSTKQQGETLRREQLWGGQIKQLRIHNSPGVHTTLLRPHSPHTHSHTLHHRPRSLRRVLLPRRGWRRPSAGA